MDWSLSGSLIVTGMTVVFVVLVLLWGAVTLMGKIVSSIAAKTAPEASAEPAVPAPNAVTGEEMAVISAAVAAARGKQDFTIREVRRVSGSH